MNENERAMLQSEGRLSSGKMIKHFLMGILLVSVAIGCLALLIISLQSKLSGFQLGAACITVVLVGIATLFVGLLCLSNALNGFTERRALKNIVIPANRAALTHGMVEVVKVESGKVIVLEEFEDEGSGYLFDVGADKTLLLKGQEYYPTDEKAAWPNTSFEIIRTEQGRLLLGLVCTGKELKPSQTIELSKCNEEFIWSEDEKVLNGTPEQILEGLLVKV